jgi:hypothetical protein
LTYRPNDTQREELLRLECEGLELSEAAIREVVALTGPQGVTRPLGFTFTDLRTRLLPEALARSFPDRRIMADDLLGTARDLEPSPTLNNEEGV